MGRRWIEEEEKAYWAFGPRGCVAADGTMEGADGWS